MFAGPLLCLAISSHVGVSEARLEVYLTDGEALRIAFPGSESIEKKLVAFTDEQRKAVAGICGRDEPPRVFRYFVGMRSGDILGYAVIEDCLGKSEPITYMVATDVAGTIRAVEILAYRESRGGEVRQQGWRKQFVGKDAGSPLRVGADVRNIAGATISCRSVADGVRLQLACLQVATRKAPGSLGVAQESKSRGPFRRARLAMGTTLEISAYADTKTFAEEAIDAAFAEVERLERILSTYREESETSRLNRCAGGDFLPVSPELQDLLARSRELTARSGGAFDVTVGPLVALWKRAAARGSSPSETDVAEARNACGLAAVETDPEHGRARLARAGAALDFGAIGKGYALDRAAVALEERNVRCALLDFGGQVLALDPPPGEAGWRVGLRDARDPEKIRSSLLLVRGSLSTTADYERGLDVGSRRVSHVVDPRTGNPVDGMLGASVVCTTATEADALSTALYVLGKEAGGELALRRSLAALLVPSQGPEFASERFRALEVGPSVPR